jgi:sugar O-acyltransferase (sialic acid O-acetyltransferase NeuD family)
MKDIAIYGAGGLGREVFCLIRNINLVHKCWNFIGFFDDGKEIGSKVSSYGTVLGGLNELNSWSHELDVVIAIGNVPSLRQVVTSIINPIVSFPNIIHPETIWVEKDSFRIGHGNIIQRACVFSCDVSLGDFNLLNGSITLGHDVCIDSCNVLMPAVRISGGTKVGSYNFFGINSIVLQGMKVGENVMLSAGSVLMTKPKNGKLYMGNPARMTEL